MTITAGRLPSLRFYILPREHLFVPFRKCVQTRSPIVLPPCSTVVKIQKKGQ